MCAARYARLSLVHFIIRLVRTANIQLCVRHPETDQPRLQCRCAQNILTARTGGALLCVTTAMMKGAGAPVSESPLPQVDGHARKYHFLLL
jgi:hypothetical protein